MLSTVLAFVGNEGGGSIIVGLGRGVVELEEEEEVVGVGVAVEGEEPGDLGFSMTWSKIWCPAKLDTGGSIRTAC